MFVSSRSMDEYLLMFDDDGHLLDGRSLLDCAAGAASFASEAAAAGSDVVAVDRLYRQEIDEVIHVSLEGVFQARQNILEEPWRYTWGGVFASPAQHVAARLVAAGRFLGDFEANVGSRYIYGELPNLPFADGSYDSVLCSHLLFAYAGTMSINDHILYIEEMLRVAREDVRIYPLVGFDGDAEGHVHAIAEYATSKGLDLQMCQSRYAFFGDAGQFMRIRK